jgi:hypothetical protein
MRFPEVRTRETRPWQCCFSGSETFGDTSLRGSSISKVSTWSMAGFWVFFSSYCMSGYARTWNNGPIHFFGALLSVPIASGWCDLDEDLGRGVAKHQCAGVFCTSVAHHSYRFLRSGGLDPITFASWAIEHEHWFSTRPKFLGLSPRRPSQDLAEFPLCLVDLVKENTDLRILSACMCVQHGSERTS